MNGNGKRIGYFALGVLALLASLGLQVVMGVVGGVAFAVKEIIMSPAQEMTEELLTELFQGAVMEGAVWGVLAYHIISLPVFGLWFYFGCGRKKPQSPLKVLTGKAVGLVAVMSLGLCVFANGLVVLEEFLMPAQYALYEQLMEVAGLGVDPLTIIASVVLAPIGEELVCRGIIFHYMYQVAAGRTGKEATFWIANVLQALFFAIMHGNLIQGSYAFLLGLGLGYLRYRYDSLYPSMLAHFLINFMSTFLMGFLLSGVPENYLGAAVMLVAGGALTAVSVVWIGKGKEAQEA